ncbi:hypothetical protein FHS19_001352 [Paenibacillus rhizosphaerae]|uniref:Uncharacterized protein n=1 Tax=Paenibacillus rhizosphaerae TaxID=297318 RepID=A0A839TMR6_9BACL|nr:hypothetical protein [Paenibacillus rhizosphaerae]MBB3126698.1 hypothetical protein [Paenibacillus rhizosphaerae]
MTQYYYIASSRELPIGSFGKNKTVMTIRDYFKNKNPSAKDQIVMEALLEKDPQGDQLMEIYETELDAAGLYVAGHPIFRDFCYRNSNEIHGGQYLSSLT